MSTHTTLAIIGLQLWLFIATPVLATPKDPPTTTELGATDYRSPQGEPLWIKSSLSDGGSAAHVYTTIKQPRASIETLLRTPAQWCELLILHSHIKGCTYQPADQNQIELELYFGDKTYRELADAEAATFTYKLSGNAGQGLHLSLTAKEGPMGSHDLVLSIEISALDTQRSLLHIGYVTHQGGMAQFMLDTYLATIGRNKLGFSAAPEDNGDSTGKIKGVRGVIERNVMRYLLALLAYLDAAGETPQQRFLNSAENWQRYSQHYVAQLKELNLPVYLKAKTGEHANQMQRQSEINKTKQ